MYRFLFVFVLFPSLAHAGEPDNRRSTYAGLIQLAQQPPRSAPIAAPKASTSDPFSPQPGDPSFATPVPVKPVASAEKPSLPPVEVKAMPKADGKFCDLYFLSGSGKFLAYDSKQHLILGAVKVQFVSDVTSGAPLGRVTVTREVLGTSRTWSGDWPIHSMQTIDGPSFDKKISDALGEE